MKRILKFFTITTHPKTTFTVNCAKHNTTPTEAFNLANEMHLNPIKKGNEVIFTPFGSTPDEHTQWIALYFYKLGHLQRNHVHPMT